MGQRKLTLIYIIAMHIDQWEFDLEFDFYVLLLQFILIDVSVFYIIYFYLLTSIVTLIKTDK